MLDIDGHLNRNTARIIRQNLKTPWLWVRSASPAAINELIRGSSLKHLYVLFSKGKGTLRGPSSLETFHVCPARVSDADMVTMMSWKTLKSLRLSCVDFKPKHISMLGNLPELRVLDLEDGNLNDAMALRLVKACPQLRELVVANNFISRRGLQTLVDGLPQLESLDIWGTRVRCEDIGILKNSPHLRYLSCGGRKDREWPGHELMKHLRLLKSLREGWLDGVKLSEAEHAEVRQLIPEVRVNRCEDKPPPAA